MKENTSKILSRFAVVMYFTLSLATTFAHDWYIDSRTEPVCKALHEQVMTNNAPAPIQYRIFQYYAAEGLIRAGIPFRGAYFFLRFLFTFLAAVTLHYFLLYWFSPVVCVLGTLYFFGALPLVYLRYYMQPMDIPNLFFMLAGCLLILKKRDLWLIPLIFVAMLNRETAILLALIYLLVRYDELELPTLAIRSGAMFIAGIAVYAALRKIFSVKHYYADLFYLNSNLTDPSVYYYAIALFGPLIPLSFYKFRDKPRFIRRALLFIPFFVIIHYTMTIMAEPRLWLPALPFMIAAGLWVVIPEELKNRESETYKPVDNAMTRHPKAAYAALLLVFMAFFTVFFFIYKNMHFADRAKAKYVESVMSSGKAFASSGMYERAIEEFNKAALLDPQQTEAHYELAVIYDFSYYDPVKALYNFKECLRLDPHNLDRVRIENEISRLEYQLKPVKKSP